MGAAQFKGQIRVWRALRDLIPSAAVGRAENFGVPRKQKDEKKITKKVRALRLDALKLRAKKKPLKEKIC